MYVNFLFRPRCYIYYSLKKMGCECDWREWGLSVVKYDLGGVIYDWSGVRGWPPCRGRQVPPQPRRGQGCRPRDPGQARTTPPSSRWDISNLLSLSKYTASSYTQVLYHTCYNALEIYKINKNVNLPCNFVKCLKRKEISNTYLFKQKLVVYS